MYYFIRYEHMRVVDFAACETPEIADRYVARGWTPCSHRVFIAAWRAHDIATLAISTSGSVQ